MLEVGGEHLDYLAFHNMFSAGSRDERSPLKGIEYRKDPARTWEHLMNACREPEAKMQAMREQVAGYEVPLALTECHFALPGRNRCKVLSSWAAGVANARILNVHEQNGDILKIATLADFCGTRWQVNAIMIPSLRGKPYMMPVARVMSLYRKHTGQKAIDVTATPNGLDVTASRTSDRVHLHVVNTNRTRSVATRLEVDGMTIQSGRVSEIATDPEFEVMETCSEVLSPIHRDIAEDRYCTFPAASVSAVELTVLGQTE